MASRHAIRRCRVLVGLIVVLGACAGEPSASTTTGAPPTETVAVETTTTTTAAPPPATRRLFIRSAHGVTARAYEANGEALEGMLSTEAVVGTASLVKGSRPQPSDTLLDLDVGFIGMAEGAPAAWAAARVAPSVALVRAAFTDGVVDEMQPVDGWALLVRMSATDTAPSGTLEAFDQGGLLVAQVPIAIHPVPESPALRLFTRITPDGVSVRGYRSGGTLLAGAANDGAIGETEAGPPLAPATLAIAAQTFGVVHEAPMTVVVTHTLTDVARVALHFDDGAVDEMEPRDGWAVLARQGSWTAGTIVGRDMTGTVVVNAPMAPPEPDRSLRRLFIRTTADGVTIRTYRSGGRSCGPLRAGAGTVVYQPGWCTPVSVGLHTQLSIPEAVGRVDRIGGYPPSSPAFVQTFGREVGRETVVVPVSVPTEATTVRSTFADGAIDEMRPVDGVAVLARQGGVWEGTVEAVAADGQVLHRAPHGPEGPPTTGAEHRIRRLFARTNPSGITVRGYVPPDPPVRLTTACSTEEAIGGSERPDLEPHGDEPLTVFRGWRFGILEGAPAICFPVYAAESVARVRLVRPDGRVADEVAPIEHWAVLAVLGTGGGTVEAVAEDGSVIATAAAAPEDE